MDAAEKHVGRNRARLQNLQEVIGARINERHGAQRIERLVLDRHAPPAVIVGLLGLGVQHLLKHPAPRALLGVGVGTRQVNQADFTADLRIAGAFVIACEQQFSGLTVARFKRDLFASDAVLGVVFSVAALIETI